MTALPGVTPPRKSDPGGDGTRPGGGGRGGFAWEIYCDGPLLEAVQSARLFPDSKTFVDMPMKQDPNQVLAAFEDLSPLDRKDPAKLARFVSEHFDEAGSDIVPATPEDFSPEPAFLAGIKDGRRREWGRAIHGLWALLVRKNVADVAANPQRHSLLPRTHPVVVPGGRFRESYYWDTFWTIRGLLVSGMVDTARGVVLNLLDDVDRFGFVPNGGRLYYAERSQPPLLSDMVCEVYVARPDRVFLARALPSLEAEHAFWMDFERGRAVCVPVPPPPLATYDAPMTVDPRGKNCATPTARQPEGAAVLLNRYWGALAPPAEEPVGLGLDDSPGHDKKGVGGPLPGRPPRPESYREDAAVALGLFARGVGGGRGDEGSGGRDSNAAAAAGVGGSTGSCAEELCGVHHHPGVCHELAAAAESGWDFSSRWAGLCSRAARSGSGERGGAAGHKEFSARNGGDKGGDVFRLCETATTSVVPVDLNAFLHRAELNIARLHHALAEHRGSGMESAPAGAVPEIGGQSPPPPPPQAPRLLSLDDIQRRFLSRRRGGGMSSWSSSSSSLVEKLSHQGDLGFATAADDDAAPETDSPRAASGGGGSDDPLSPGGESLPLSRQTMLFLAAARARAKAMEQTMWDGRSALWRDVLLPTGEQSSSITPACFVPMWAGLPWPVLDDGAGAGVSVPIGAAADSESGLRLARCVEALRQSGLVLPGGVQTSLEESGQQWDGPNAWPPLQWLLIQGLRRSAEALVPAAAAAAPPPPPGDGDGEAPEKAASGTAAASAAASARALASELEEAFLAGALAGWEASGGMMEKYNANDTGKGGGGGEYSVQVGFGWTNGVALDLLAGERTPTSSLPPAP
eukprot:g18650.t1